MKPGKSTVGAVLICGALLWSHAAGAQVAPDAKAPVFSLTALDGEVHNLAQYEGRTVVLEWTNLDCPFVRKHYSIGAMQTLQKKYTEKGIVWLTICSSAPGKQGHFDVPTWEKRLAEADAAPSAVLLDELGNVGRMYGATRTPQMFVIDPEGRIVYMGAIDDDRSADSSKVKGARNYVVEALKALETGGEVAMPATPSYGCTVKY